MSTKQEVAFRRVTEEQKRNPDKPVTKIMKDLKISPTAYYAGRKAAKRDANAVRRAPKAKAAASLRTDATQTFSFRSGNDNLFLVVGSPEQLARFVAARA